MMRPTATVAEVPMNRRKAWAALAVVAAALVAVAWVLLHEPEAPRAPPENAASSGTPGGRAHDAARAAGEPIPFSPSRVDAPAPAGPAARGAHRTAPPQPLPHTLLRHLLPALLAQANAKPPNGEAAMSAYDILTYCRRLAASPPEQAADKPDCAGITEADWKDAGRLLRLAAETGNERAQLTFAQRLVGLGREPDELARNREELAEAHQKARDYLNSLAERGNVDAMWFLGESLRFGENSEPDLVRAYAYKYAVARAGGYPYTIDAELARLEAQLTAQDQNRARQLADQLISRCCAPR